MSKRKFINILILNILLGWFGIHRFVTGYKGIGFLYLFSCGGLGVGVLIDLILLLSGCYKEKNGQKILPPYKKNKSNLQTNTFSTTPTPISGYNVAFSYENIKIALCGINLDLISLRLGDLLNFKVDPQSDHRVKISIKSTDIGYMYDDKLIHMIKGYLIRKDPFKAYLTNIDFDKNEIKMTLFFYQKDDLDYKMLKESGAPLKKFKIHGNLDEEMQSNILLSCSYGNEVEFLKDIIKDRTAVWCDTQIGYLPLSAERYMKNSRSFIDKIEINDKGNLIVTISMFYKSKGEIQAKTAEM